MNRYLVAVRIAPGKIRPLLIISCDPMEACDDAESLAHIMYRHPCPVVSCHRWHIN